MKTIEVAGLSAGKPKTCDFHGKPVESAIFKQPVDGSVFLTKTGLAGDKQADQVNHGGPDKAVCAYSHHHYPYWEDIFGSALQPGAFGENLTIDGLTEEKAFIGDIFEWGEAEIQLAQPRKPCFKLAMKSGIKDLQKQFEDTGWTGYYFRVLKEGLVSADSPLRLISREDGSMSIAELNHIRFISKDQAGYRKIADLPLLAEAWRGPLIKKLD